mmetsp:Transcript_29753/g.86313  ORF Transcript_29753/g.86313 Transcript_29753/m.86313 type:complete len:245 (-) Transcript_29753:458-1192(-)
MDCRQSMTFDPSSTTALHPSQRPRLAANRWSGCPCGHRICSLPATRLAREPTDDTGAWLAPSKLPRSKGASRARLSMSKPVTFWRSCPKLHRPALNARTPSSARCFATSTILPVSSSAWSEPLRRFSAVSDANRSTSTSSVGMRARTVSSTWLDKVRTSSEAFCACSAASRDVRSMAEAARAARSTQPGMRPTPSSAHIALQKFWQLLWMSWYWLPRHSLAKRAVKTATSCLLSFVWPSGTVVR